MSQREMLPELRCQGDRRDGDLTEDRMSDL